jgi:hypothetical protein
MIIPPRSWATEMVTLQKVFYGETLGELKERKTG